MNDQQPTSPRAPESFNVRKAGLAVSGMACFGALCVAGMAVLLHFWHSESTPAAAPKVLFEDDITHTDRGATLQAKQRRRIESWELDRDTGAARIPIQTAMQLLVDRAQQPSVDAGTGPQPSAAPAERVAP